MILHCAAGEGWRLDDAANFRDFKVVLAGLSPDEAPPLDGLAFAAGADGAVYAWVRPDLPARLAGATADEAWRADFAGMVAYAARHGWVRADGTVRAHIERTG